jgi:hypothetical protein
MPAERHTKGACRSVAHTFSDRGAGQSCDLCQLFSSPGVINARKRKGRSKITVPITHSDRIEPNALEDLSDRIAGMRISFTLAFIERASKVGQF